jgi:hypothetical protein
MDRLVCLVQGCAPYDLVLSEAGEEPKVYEELCYLGASLQGGAVVCGKPSWRVSVRLKVNSSHASTTALMMVIWQLNQVVVDSRKWQVLKCRCVVLVTASRVVMKAANLESEPPTPDSDIDSTLITGAMCSG